jgi:pimeloyl-ACP methyl ester carboxylesterase
VRSLRLRTTLSGLADLRSNLGVVQPTTVQNGDAGRTPSADLNIARSATRVFDARTRGLVEKHAPWAFCRGTARSIRDVVRLGIVRALRGCPPASTATIERTTLSLEGNRLGLPRNWTLTVRTARHTDSKPRDLFVIAPGMFQGINDEKALKIFAELSHLGHVAIVPNGFSEEYERQIPGATLGSFVQEAALLRAFVDSLKAKWGKSIQKVNLIGTSQGGFVAAVALGQQDRDRMTFDGKTILLNPPFSETSVGQCWDRLANDLTTHSFSDRLIGKLAWEGSILPMSIRVLEKYLRSKREDSPELHASRYSAARVEALERMLPNTRELSPADLHTLRRARDRSVHSGVRFMSIIETCPDDVRALYASESNEIAHHLQKASRAGGRWGLITSDDDFIVPPGAWDRLPSELRLPDRFLKTKSGGHVWYLGGSTLDLWQSIFTR